MSQREPGHWERLVVVSCFAVRQDTLDVMEAIMIDTNSHSQLDEYYHRLVTWLVLIESTLYDDGELDPRDAFSLNANRMLARMHQALDDYPDIT